MAAEAQPRSAQPEAFVEPGDFVEVGSEDGGLRIYLRYDLFRALDEYALRDTSRELAALLVGQVQEANGGGPSCIVVEDAIEVGIGGGDEKEGRFSPRVWQHARRVARTRYASKVIVGWYHTHPGIGLDLSQEERDIHRAFFPEAWQVVYVSDPVTRDRNFYRTEDGRLTGLRGFRIFGKEAAALKEKKPVGEPPVSPGAPPPVAGPLPQRNEEPARERYVERSLEKLLRGQRRPPVRPIDMLLLALLTLNLLATLLKPSARAQVDATQLNAPLNKISAQVNTMASRLDKLERHLQALQIMDEQLSAPSATPTALPEDPLKPGVGLAPPDGSSEVLSYTVKEGDALSRIAEQYYGSSALASALGKYNKVRAEEIIVGSTLKIPAKDKLH